VILYRATMLGYFFLCRYSPKAATNGPAQPNASKYSCVAGEELRAQSRNPEVATTASHNTESESNKETVNTRFEMIINIDVLERESSLSSCETTSCRSSI
jgi:hypothetical protein